MSKKIKIVFLHIPKTAGQSIHYFLSKLVGEKNVAPFRVNEQLMGFPISKIQDYQVFSGHLDWSLIDCVENPKFVFTVLRDPAERIISFYFFLRKEAERLNEKEIDLPENQGKKAILNLSCDDYFCRGPSNIRTFLDNHYDNFYTYYFSGRTFDSRQKIKISQRIYKNLTDSNLVEIAIDNMRKLQGVYLSNSLDLLQRDLCSVMQTECSGSPLKELKMNIGDVSGITDRRERLRHLGATELTFSRIDEMTNLDNLIWKNYGGL